jgi:cobalamin biosynthesis protein CbiD
MAQRRYYKLNKGLTQRHKERRQLLNRAGFAFSVDRRGPRMAKLKERSKDKNIKDMDNFVGFMIDNKNELSEVEKREAWKMRFSVYQK